MLAWRISLEKHALERTGKGAEIYGGRWNLKGTAAIYAGLTPEIAALEKLVHTSQILPELVLVEITLPDDNKLYIRPTKENLPTDWDALPSSNTSAKFGENFLSECKFLGLIIPSAIMPEAFNIVVNPSHSKFKEVNIKIIRKFEFDSRLFNKA